MHILRACFLAGVLALAGTFTFAQKLPPAAPPKQETPTEEIKLPVDAIIVAVDKANDLLRSLPKYYLLSPDRYKALMDEKALLEKQLAARQPYAVTEWRISGKVITGGGENKAELTATFKFRTDADRATVALGCRGVPLTRITLDKKTPSLWQGEKEGLMLEVEEKGDHEAEVRMELPLREQSPLGPGRPGPLLSPQQGFELDLPLTGVNRIDLELPNKVKPKDVEVNDRAVDSPLALQGNRLEGPLGRAKGLKVWWKMPRAVASPVLQLNAIGRVTVRVRDGHAQSEAELALQDVGGTSREWRLQVPEKAAVRVTSPAEGVRVQGSESPDGRVTLTLAKPTSDPIKVLVTVRQARSGPVSVGPFAVVGATQRGDVYFVGTSGQRVRLAASQPDRAVFSITPRAKTDRNDTPTGTIAGFQYWGLTGAEKADTRDPWFRFDFETLQGTLEAALTHTLRLADSPADWRLTTVIDATPVRTEVDVLDVDWPAPWSLDKTRTDKPDVVTSVGEETADRRVRLELASSVGKPFKLTLEGQPAPNDRNGVSFPVAANQPFPSAVVKLPRPRGTHNRGSHQVIVLLPESLDGRVPQPPNPRMELVSQEAQRLVWRTDSVPAEVAVAWKPYRAELRVDSLLDVTLAENQAKVRQRLTLHFEDPGRVPREIVLRGPASVLAGLEVNEGGELQRGDEQLGPVRGARFLLRPKAGEATQVLEVEYTTVVGEFRASKAPEVALQRQVGVPLVWVAGATHGQTRARVWGEPGSRILPGTSAWEEAPTEVVASRSRLPSLVLRSPRLATDLPLRIELPLSGSGTHPVVVERALLQVRVSEGGFQQHRARFLVRQLGEGGLELALPAPPATSDLQVAFDGRKVEWDAVTLPAASRSGRHLIRLRLPPGVPARPAVLEVTYQLAPTRGGVASTLRTVLEPATIPSLAAGVPTRWEIDLPAGWVPLPLEGGNDDSWRWGRRGWLLAPMPAVTHGELEHWFWGESGRGPGLSEDEAGLIPSHVCWRSGPAPLALSHVPQQAWLLVCSVGVLLVGLLLGRAALRLPGEEGGRGRLFWFILSGLGAGLAVVALLWPGLLAAVFYGGQPGVVVLLTVLLVHWFLHDRRRRRVVFLPGFRRVNTGSSLIRHRGEANGRSGSNRDDKLPVAAPSGRASGSAPRPRPEPSTVDEPQAEAE
jgi:hypothetical protein